MFEDLINKDKIMTQGPSKEDIIKALKWNIKEKEKLIEQYTEQLNKKMEIIKKLTHEIKYLKKL